MKLFESDSSYIGLYFSRSLFVPFTERNEKKKSFICRLLQIRTRSEFYIMAYRIPFSFLYSRAYIGFLPSVPFRNRNKERERERGEKGDK